MDEPWKQVIEQKMETWRKMPPRFKIQTILEDVLELTTFESADMAMSLVTKDPEKITFPFACWHETRREWMIMPAKGAYAQPFDPLTRLDDAWKIIEWTRHLPGGLRYQFDFILNIMLRAAVERNIPSKLASTLRLDHIAALTPEIICEAAIQLRVNNEVY